MRAATEKWANLLVTCIPSCLSFASGTRKEMSLLKTLAEIISNKFKLPSHSNGSCQSPTGQPRKERSDTHSHSTSLKRDTNFEAKSTLTVEGNGQYVAVLCLKNRNLGDFIQRLIRVAIEYCRQICRESRTRQARPPRRQ